MKIRYVLNEVTKHIRTIEVTDDFDVNSLQARDYCLLDYQNSPAEEPLEHSFHIASVEELPGE